MSNTRSDDSGINPMADLRFMEFCFRVTFQSLGSVPHMFIRRRFGTHYFGLTTALGIGFFWLYYAMMIEASFSEPFALVFLAWLVMNVWHRSVAFKNDRGIHRVHSRYNGWPLLCDLLPISEQAAKSNLEPIFIILCSMVFIPLKAPCLLIFFVVAGFAGAIENTMTNLRMKARVRQLQDAEIEHQVLMEEFDQESR